MKQFSKKMPWSLMSRYRAPLMGMAMICIYLTHYKKAFTVNRVSPIPWYIMNLRFGSSGVDIFLILSGLGLCYSFSKDSNLFRFYRKRIVRLLPAYLITEVIYYIMLLVKDGSVNIRIFLEKMFFIRFFRNGDAAFWFIIAILVCYLIFPLLYKVLGITKYSLLNLVLCIAVFVVFHELLWRHDLILYKNTIALVQRIPAFIFGVWVGRECLENKEFPVVLIPLCWAVTIVMMIYGYIPFLPRPRVTLYDFTLSLVGLSLIFLFLLLFEWLKGTVIMDRLMQFLTFMGGITLECYLMHSLLKWIFFSPVDPVLYLITCCILPTIAAWLLHIVCAKIIKLIG